MSWELTFETDTHDALAAHAASFAKTLTREGDSGQVGLAVDHASTVVSAIGATKFRATIGGHVPEATDKKPLPASLYVHVTRTDPPPKPAPNPVPVRP